MTYNVDFSIATSEQIERALCARVEAIRLARNITQAWVAKEARISERTLRRLENGQGTSLETLIRVLVVLGLQQNLEALLPDPGVRPIERVRLGGFERRRAHGEGEPQKGEQSWKWADEKADDE